MMIGLNSYYEVREKDGKFRISFHSCCGDNFFIINHSTGKALEFSSQEKAEKYIDQQLSVEEWPTIE
jgi:hypothetical protein